MRKIEHEYCDIVIDDSPEAKDKIFELLVRYINLTGGYGGEVIMQSDNCIIEAPQTIASMVENVVKSIEYKD